MDPLEKSVLVVDDEDSICRMLTRFLERDGYAVVSCTSAREALDRLAGATFDIIISDILMPETDGISLLEQLNTAAPSVPVIMMTGRPTIDTAARALKYGAFDYLTKPLSKSTILRAVHNAARMKQLKDEKQRLAAELKASEQKYRQLFHYSLDGIASWDSKGFFRECNPSFEQVTGYDIETLRTLHSLEITPDKWHSGEAEIGRRLLQWGASGLFEKEFICKDGSILPVEVNMYRVPDEAGETRFIWGIVRDISRRKAAERKQDRVIRELKDALDNVKTLEGLLPVCSKCKKIRDDSGYWKRLDMYIADHFNTRVSHGICPDCMKELYGHQKWYQRRQEEGEES